MILAVSDTCAGYSTPQIPVLLDQLGQYYAEEVLLVEPDLANRPLTPDIRRHFGVPIQRIVTDHDAHALASGREEYIAAAAQLIDTLQPRVLVVTCAFVMDVLDQIQHRPELTIYQSLELAQAYSPPIPEQVRRACNRVTVAIFPERNRIDIDAPLLGDTPILLMLNATVRADEAELILPADNRIQRIMITARHGVDSFGLWYNLFNDIPIDLFGKVDDSRLLTGLPPSIRYFGIVAYSELPRVRRSYAWSFVGWNPSNLNQRFAAPNKMFESIAAGVPVVCAPHPQCIELCREYGVGICAASFDRDALKYAMQHAVATTPRDYAAMVDNCQQATRLVLNREAQFAVLRTWLEESGFARNCQSD